MSISKPSFWGLYVLMEVCVCKLSACATRIMAPKVLANGDPIPKENVQLAQFISFLGANELN